MSRGGNMSSFRPEGAYGKRPDLLPETRKSLIFKLTDKFRY